MDCATSAPDEKYGAEKVGLSVFTMPILGCQFDADNLTALQSKILLYLLF